MDSTDKAFLILADGTVFEGKAFGARGQTIGETVFTTGMTGYLETLTDPSYFGQIVTQTFPLIGNYGVMKEDYESKKSWVKGYIVRELCQLPSNFRCQGNLENFLTDQGVIGIAGIDTRALTKKLRDSGVMNGMILSGPAAASLLEKNNQIKIDKELLKNISAYKIEGALESVQNGSSTISQSTGVSDAPSTIAQSSGVADAPSTIAQSTGVSDAPSPAPQSTSGTPPLSLSGSTRQSSPRVVLFDFGAKANIQRELEKRNCQVTVLPYNTSAQKVLELNPDGIMLSNGPGDPADNTEVIQEIKKLCEYGKIPIFGICLGHQMLALARGAKTSKLKYGHRGGNHPVKDTQTGRVYITSQNHGYAVENQKLPAYARESFVNVNDGTCEGLDYTDIPAFSVQFHPEACGGPHDTNFLFDKFMKMMEANRATK